MSKYSRYGLLMGSDEREKRLGLLDATARARSAEPAYSASTGSMAEPILNYFSGGVSGTEHRTFPLRHQEDLDIRQVSQQPHQEYNIDPELSSFELMGFVSLPEYPNYRGFDMEYATGDIRDAPALKELSRWKRLKQIERGIPSDYTGLSSAIGRHITWPRSETKNVPNKLRNLVLLQEASGASEQQNYAGYPALEIHEIGGHQSFRFFQEYPDTLDGVMYYNPVTNTNESLKDALFTNSGDFRRDIAHKIIYSNDFRQSRRKGLKDLLEEEGAHPQEYTRLRSIYRALDRISKRIIEKSLGKVESLST